MVARLKPMPSEPVYEPEVLVVGSEWMPLSEELVVLDEHLIAKQRVDAIATALKHSAFVFDADDAVTLATAEDLKVVDADEYRRGYELLEELSVIEERITKWYARFDKPLNFLVAVVRGLKSPTVAQVSPLKKALSQSLGKWKADQERADRLRAEEQQRAADLAAKAAQDARAATLERVAEAEVDPKLAASFRAEAENVRNVEVHAAPVEAQSSVPVVAGGYTTTRWKCRFDNLTALMQAYVEGKVFFPDEVLIEKGLQGYMDKQAQNLAENLGRAFPGCSAIPDHGAVKRRGK